MNKLNLLLCFLLFLLITYTSSAQIINVESARMQSDTVGWMGGGSLGLQLRQNGENVFGFDASAHVQYKTSRDKGLWLLLGDVGFLRGGHIKYISNRFAHLRYNYKVNPWLRWEIFGQVLNNVITQIHSRMLIGTGPRFKIAKTSIIRLYAATLVMYEQEKEITDPVTRHNDMRSSSYVSFTFTPRENIELISTTFYQPLFRDFKDVRILNQAMLKVRATRHFSLSVMWNYLHDSRPAGTSLKTTYALSTGISVEL